MGSDKVLDLLLADQWEGMNLLQKAGWGKWLRLCPGFFVWGSPNHNHNREILRASTDRYLFGPVFTSILACSRPTASRLPPLAAAAVLPSLPFRPAFVSFFLFLVVLSSSYPPPPFRVRTSFRLSLFPSFLAYLFSPVSLLILISLLSCSLFPPPPRSDPCIIQTPTFHHSPTARQRQKLLKSLPARLPRPPSSSHQ